MSLPADLYWKPDLPPHWHGVGLWISQSGHGTKHPDLVGDDFGFNLGVHVGDSLQQVEQRRHLLQATVGCPIQWLNQVHGCTAVQALGAGAVPDADASYTTQPDVALAIMTADCLPAVFVAFDAHDKPAGIAAAHAGWRGLHAGVLQHAVVALRAQAGQSIKRVECFLGPAIGPDSFEVGGEVRSAFVAQNPLAESCFKASATGLNKHLADLYGLARLALGDVGVRDVLGGGQDTLTDSRWFSHRRGQQQGRPAGRFATVARLLQP